MIDINFDEKSNNLVEVHKSLKSARQRLDKYKQDLSPDSSEFSKFSDRSEEFRTGSSREKSKKIINSKDYDPYEYWNLRKHPNRRPNYNLIKETEKFFLTRYISGEEKLFELGPGDGRLFPLYQNKSLVTLDLTKNYKDVLDRKAKKFGIKLSQSWYKDPCRSLPFKDDCFDAAIACQVLIHIPFTQIEHIISELARISSKVLILSGYNSSWPKKQDEVIPKSHCFAHDYINLIRKETDLRILEYKLCEKGQKIFLCAVKS